MSSTEMWTKRTPNSRETPPVRVRGLITFATWIIFLAVSMSPWWFCPISAMMKHGCSPPIFRPGQSSKTDAMVREKPAKTGGARRKSGGLTSEYRAAPPPRGRTSAFATWPRMSSFHNKSTVLFLWMNPGTEIQACACVWAVFIYLFKHVQQKAETLWQVNLNTLKILRSQNFLISLTKNIK